MFEIKNTIAGLGLALMTFTVPAAASVTIDVHAGNDSIPVIENLLGLDGLSFIKYDDGEPNGSFETGGAPTIDIDGEFSITFDTLKDGEPGEYIGGTFSNNVDFVAAVIKASEDFILIDFGGMATAGTTYDWCTDGSCSIGGEILDAITNTSRNGRERPAAISHLTLYFDESETTPGVPEPATWLMMILGFALTASSVKRRRLATVA